MWIAALILLIASPQDKEIYKPDFVIVADEIDQWDGTVTRSVYCFKNLPNEKNKIVPVLMGVLASYPENIKYRGDTVKWGQTVIVCKHITYYKGAPDPVHEFVGQFDYHDQMWFGYPVFGWWG